MNPYSKKINPFVCGLLLLLTTACSDYLAKEPFDIITPDKVWQDAKVVNAVLVNLYDKMYLEQFNDWYRDAWRLMTPSSMSDESQGAFQKDPLFDNPNATYTYENDLFGAKFTERWYPGIRNCNDFLAQLKEASMDESEKQILDAEVRFIRAWHYFSLVKRYGGLPLITEAQEYDPGNLESLQSPRNKEVEMYDFIVKECLEIAQALPVNRDAAVKYRADRGTALALCSRAALYAGSIAKYGNVQLDGIVGIASSESQRFFQSAYEASKELIGLGKYTLYNKSDDKSQNYCDIFTKSTNGENGEYIFQKQYNVSGGIGHDWDKRNAPFSFRAGGWGCGIAPTLEMVEEYEYTDGRPGKLALTHADGTLKRFENPLDLFEGKDPRLFATVYLPGSPCKGSFVEVRRGLITPNGDKIESTKQPDAGETYEHDGVVYNVSGKDAGSDTGDQSKTGFYQKKFWDETLQSVDMGKSETPWVIFRLAEIYLNLAEAAIELGGKEAEALDAVNLIRARAGIQALTAIDREKVRHERKVELAFEGHRFWDMKRWRIAHLDASQGGLNNFRGSALYPWYNLSDGAYTFETSDRTPKQVRIFLERNYYTRINDDDMNSNPKLVQNPGYTN
ncbi:MAG: RagB/SusD family nutrient uptake outer membrane protein [Tannerellaceae bacterium]|jgi:hypothetical protein|nr:RagB/SusD family nutrient uptake outer membrane protein [Tannerellaceae bacterium]